MPEYIINPETGRLITKYGVTHKRLLSKEKKKKIHIALTPIHVTLKKKEKFIEESQSYLTLIHEILFKEGELTTSDYKEVLNLIKFEMNVLKDFEKSVIASLTHDITKKR